MNKQQMALALAACLLILVAYGTPIILKLAQVLLKTFPKIFRLFSLISKDQNALVLGEIRLTDHDRVRHTHIVGATGSGKTVLLENLIYEDLRRGRGALIIDPKGDRELFERVKDFCQKIGRETDLHLLSATYKNESVRWNPCRLGTASEIQSKILNSFTFSEVFYQKTAEDAFLTAVKESMAQNFHLPHIVTQLKAQAIDKNLQGLYSDIKNLTNSEWGEILCAEAPQITKKEICLLDIVRKNEILFVDLPTEGKSVESAKIGKLILQEIMLISSLRKSYPAIQSKIPFSVFVDEFDAFATPSFATFQNKARSSNFMIHIAHQTLSDLNAINPDFMGKILGNTNVRFIFRQDDPKDAETWSNFFGTQNVLKKTFRASGGTATGEESVRESKEFRIHPDAIKELPVGQCIFSVKSSKSLKTVTVPLARPKFFSRPTLRPAHDYLAMSVKNHPKEM